MKRLFFLFMTMAFGLLSLNATITNPISCGPSLTWSYDTETTVLTIEGTGEMTSSTWKDYSGVKNNMTRVLLPTGLTNIGYQAFSGCRNLASVNIPSSVNHIDVSAFYGCTSLTTITIPGSVQTIDYEAFKNCTGLLSVSLGEGIQTLGSESFQGCTGITSVVIPNSVTSIGSTAFYGCTSLNSVSIGDHVATINGSAFGNTPITSIVIPNSVTKIGNGAFSGCSQLATITLGNGITEIGRDAFRDCNVLSTVNITDIAAWCRITFDMGTNPAYCNPMYYSKGFSINGSEVTDLVIPDGVTSINGRAFAGGEHFTSVTIPASVDTINRNAFFGCTGLQSVNISDISAWLNIDFWNGTPYSTPFYYASTCYLNGEEVTEIEVPEDPDFDFVKDYTFYGWNGLTSITLPSTIRYLSADHTFIGCSSLTSIICNAVNAPALYTVWGLTAANVNVYIPCGSLASYQANSYWSRFNLQEVCEDVYENYTRYVTRGNFGTICLPWAIAAEDIRGGDFYNILYAVTDANRVLTGIVLEKQTRGLEAGKPYIFLATAEQLVLPHTGDPVESTVWANGLIGNLSERPLQVPNDMYVLSNNEIRKVNGGQANCGQYRAYINLERVEMRNEAPAPAPNRVVLNIENSSETTGMENVKAGDTQKIIRDGQLLIIRDGQTYNVLGQTF